MRLNPGDTAPKTGSYKVVDQYGSVLNTVNVAKGDTMPPTQSAQYHYEID
ncbi:MAG: hypothetical protein IJF71_00995 [Clostridia bacterium]|nr:hypothetical protein [Clostridia bacterium]